MSRGTLYLVPTPLDHGYPAETWAPLSQLLPLATIARAASLQHWVSENAKSTRAFLNRVHAVTPLTCPLQSMSLTELPRAIHKKGDHHTSDLSEAKGWLAPALQGCDMGLASEAGMPAIADPGSSVVRAAHALGLPVKPLSGPVSLMLALAASGLNGQHFAFHGYLPLGDERATRIRQLEANASQTGQAQIVIETPYRNAALLQTLVATLKPHTRLAIAAGLTLDEQVISQTVTDWRQKKPLPSIEGPAVFMWGP
jgi:16S rRNA (cytidine1402-2'-O)-methyltransferase